jgi:hypothetical protein
MAAMHQASVRVAAVLVITAVTAVTEALAEAEAVRLVTLQSIWRVALAAAALLF